MLGGQLTLLEAFEHQDGLGLPAVLVLTTWCSLVAPVTGQWPSEFHPEGFERYAHHQAPVVLSPWWRNPSSHIFSHNWV